MSVIEHSPMCPHCGVAHVEEADGQPCTEGHCTGRVSWEATADAYRQQLQGAVGALRELLAALDDTLGPVPSDGEWDAIVKARRTLRESEQPGALALPRTDQPKEDR